MGEMVGRERVMRRTARLTSVGMGGCVPVPAKTVVAVGAVGIRFGRAAATTASVPPAVRGQVEVALAVAQTLARRLEVNPRPELAVIAVARRFEGAGLPAYGVARGDGRRVG